MQGTFVPLLKFFPSLTNKRINHVGSSCARWLDVTGRTEPTEVLDVGILVRDVEEAASRLGKLLGIGPFRIFEPDYRNLMVHGRPARYKVRLGLAMAGPVQLELIQPLLGNTSMMSSFDEKDMEFIISDFEHRA
jgi:hypothetical protein